MRYEHEKPGYIIHLDSKKLGRIDGVGHRITGDRPKRQRGGWLGIPACLCVDDNSRLACSALLPDEKAVSADCFQIRTVGWFEDHGVKVRRVMTGNGSCYLSRVFQAAVQKAGAKHIRTWPYTPRTNGKA